MADCLILHSSHRTLTCLRRSMLWLVNYTTTLAALFLSLLCSTSCASNITFDTYPTDFEYIRGHEGFVQDCNVNNLPDDYVIAFVLNGEVISAGFEMMNTSVTDQYLVTGNDNRLSLRKDVVEKIDNGNVYNCRIYNSTTVLYNQNYPFVLESPPARLTVLYPPLSSDPQCELAVTFSQDKALATATAFCCVQLTTSALKLKWVQRPVEWRQQITGTVSSINSGEKDCLEHELDDKSLESNSYVCQLSSDNITSVRQSCVIKKMKWTNISYIEYARRRVKLRCDSEARDVIGYSWTVSPVATDLTLSEDRSTISFLVKFVGDVREVYVTCTAFTKTSFGRGSLIVKEQPLTSLPPPGQNRQILFVIGGTCGVVICILIFIIIVCLIRIRGWCFCFPTPEGYTDVELQRMKQERESLKPNSYNRENGMNGMSENLNNHLHEASRQDAEQEVPPVPGGNRQFSSHLLNYADLDHGNINREEAEESLIPDKSDQVTVEYADILKPPTQPLREMS